MPPPLALALGLAFISFIIYLEHKYSKVRGPVTWMVAIWLLYLGSKGLGFFLNVNTTIEAGSLPDRYFLLILGTIAALILIKRHLPLSLALGKNKAAAIVIFYSLTSVIWSTNPSISFRRWGREAIALIIALLLISEEKPDQTLLSSFKKAIYAALSLSIILIKYFPSYGRSYGRWSGEVMWEGIASQKNGLAIICAMSILLFLWEITQIVRDKRFIGSRLIIIIDIFMIILALSLMMGPQKTLTYSATSLLALIAGLVSLALLQVWLKSTKNLNKKLIAIALILIIVGITIPLSGKIPLKSLPKLLNRNETLTNRMAIWNSLLPFIKKHIWLGYGFGGFWTSFKREQIGSHAHNGYLNTLLELGLIGLFLFIVFIIKVLKQSLILLISDNQIAIFFVSLIMMILVRNIAEVSLGEFASFSTWPLLAWSFIATKQDNTSSNRNEEFLYD